MVDKRDQLEISLRSAKYEARDLELCCDSQLMILSEGIVDSPNMEVLTDRTAKTLRGSPA